MTVTNFQINSNYITDICVIKLHEYHHIFS